MWWFDGGNLFKEDENLVYERNSNFWSTFSCGLTASKSNLYDTWMMKYNYVNFSDVATSLQEIHDSQFQFQFHFEIFLL